MCGIVGLWQQAEVDRENFLSMRDALAHRGPDDCGVWFSGDGRLALGHRRLSLVDLTADGRQPMSNEDGAIWLTYNGEIYNFPELRAELERRGHVFHSHTDSEVIVHGYEEWGPAVLQRMKGMFAFALWDGRREKLFLARDRFGIKPLYYYAGRGLFSFASEIKALLRHPHIRPEVEPASLAAFLTYRYVPSPGTIWRDVFKVPPAHYLEYDRQGGLRLTEYWRLSGDDRRIPRQEAVERVGHLLDVSVRQHTLSDVPVGSFLSGGYDSSALLAYLRQMNYPAEAFAIGFHDWPASEHRYAQVVADHLNVPLHTALVSGDQLDLLDTLVYHYDEPIADISIIPTYVVSGLAAQRRKAVLSGEGADELFGGYSWQKQIARFSRRRARWESLLESVQLRRVPFFVEQYAEAMAMGRFTSANLPSILQPDLHSFIPGYSEWFYRSHYRPDLAPLKAFQYLDVKCFMGELVLTKIDRASMAHSLEVRVPFLDHELVEFVFSLHPSVYFDPAITKYLLWANIRDRLPGEILRRPKQGFVGPDTYYMNIDWYRRQLVGGRLTGDGIIRPEGIETLLRQRAHWELWKLTVLEKWWRRWL